MVPGAPELPILDDLLHLQPAWMAEGACRGRPDVSFFPELGEETAPAKAVCAGCPVREACLAFALDERIGHGVWGGLSTKQRRDLVKGRGRGTQRRQLVRGRRQAASA